MFLIQAIILLAAIYFGTRYKGMSLGLISALGLASLVFIFRIQPDRPPLDVPIIILSMVTAVGALEAAGGLDFFIKIAERIIKKYPRRITFLSPFIVYIVTFFSGTGHTIYSILPIIARVSKDMRVRPERPLSVSVIAAQQAAIASPISVPTVVALNVLTPLGVSLPDLLKICIPATLIGTFVASLAVSKMGRELPVLHHNTTTDNSDVSGKVHSTLNTIAEINYAKRSALLFLIGIGLIIMLGSVKGMRPSYDVNGVNAPIDMTYCIVIMMLSTAGVMLMTCRLSPQSIVSSKSFSTGIQAAISILGLSWLGATFVKSNQSTILEAVRDTIARAPWMFSILLFGVCVVLMSQSNTIRLIVPIGIALGIKAPLLLAAIPAVNSVFFIPSYPTAVAAMALDTTGTTRVGKYILNHSFMIPGLVATITSTLVAYALTIFLF